MPFGIVFAILILGIIKSYRKQRDTAIILTGVALLFYLFSCPFCSELLAHSLETRYTPPERPKGDVIIWLGGGATLDTPNVNGKGNVSGFAANRLLTVLQLYRKLGIPIIVSGGQVFQTTGPEAKIAGMTLRGAGVPGSRIIVEGRSLNTTENARFTQRLLVRRHFRRPILVTSAFHMPRAVKQFEKAGVKVSPYPSDYHTNIVTRFEYYKLIPAGDAFFETGLIVKEYLGLLAAKWY